MWINAYNLNFIAILQSVTVMNFRYPVSFLIKKVQTLFP